MCLFLPRYHETSTATGSQQGGTNSTKDCCGRYYNQSVQLTYWLFASNLIAWLKLQLTNIKNVCWVENVFQLMTLLVFHRPDITVMADWVWNTKLLTCCLPFPPTGSVCPWQWEPYVSWCHASVGMSVMLVGISTVTSFASFKGMKVLKFHFVFVFSVMKKYFILNYGSFLQINIMSAETSSFDWLGD